MIENDYHKVNYKIVMGFSIRQELISIELYKSIISQDMKEDVFLVSDYTLGENIFDFLELNTDSLDVVGTVISSLLKKIKSQNVISEVGIGSMIFSRNDYSA